ncbi:MAG TPA: methyltransferase [Flavitalea sp.]|nr:methyltransferase [Flavitalea sp.]
MANTYFRFKQFRVNQARSAMKVSTDACLFGAWVAATLKPFDLSGTALDIGTGTGLLALMIAQEIPLHIDAVELEEGAYTDARENFLDSPFRDRLRLIHSDIRQYRVDNSHYQLIISNPPFYTNSLRGPLAAKNLAHHDDNLEMETLFDSISMWLSEEGYAAIIYPYNKKGIIERHAASADLHPRAMAAVCPEAGQDFTRIMYIFQRRPTEKVSESVIHIKDDKDEYTELFKNFVRPYYLAF